MAASDAARLIVSIYGKNYTFALTPEQRAEHIQEVALLVDEQMRRVYQETRIQSPLQLAILAGLNLVEELQQLKADYEDAESEIAQRTSRLAASLGRVFQGIGAETPRQG
ncbi:MAG: cell division protein ZapA [Candidatus Handelsmanbacteria bacterium]|nr:cell division protein ZapA [Candidatus Handelsmanbacteria bacterium]